MEENYIGTLRYGLLLFWNYGFTDVYLETLYTTYLRAFPQSFHVHNSRVPEFRTQTFSSTHFPIHNSPVTVTLDTVRGELETSIFEQISNKCDGG